MKGQLSLWLEQLVICDPYDRVTGAIAGGVDRAEGLDAFNECEHGRLFGDPTPPCGCWAEPVPLPLFEAEQELVAA